MSYGQITVAWGDDNTAKIKGWVCWPGVDFNFYLKPIQYDNGPGKNDPTHSILAPTARGLVVNAGVCWRQKIENGDNAGRPMWSLAFDLPHFPQQMRLAAFEADGAPEDTLYNVVWRRPGGGNS